MKKYFWLLAIMVFIFAGCSNHQKEKTKSNTNEEGTLAMSTNLPEVLIGNLISPWDIEKGNDTFYISERNGTITSWQEGNKKERLPVQTTKGIAQRGEGGLLGIKLSPNFIKSNQAYAYHTYQQDGNLYNRVIVIEKKKNKWQEVSVLLEGITGNVYHNGGRIEIGPDKKLYVTVGDAGNKPSAQDKNALTGKILRMNLDGSIPKDNPFKDSYVYSYGHRNPQGLAWDKNDQLYASEHGPDAHDEINQIIPGQNYGWPIIIGNEQKEGMVTPIYQTGNDTWAPSGIAIQNNALYIATLRGTAVRKMKLDKLMPEELITEFGRIRDVEIIDNYLYFITNNTDGRGVPRPEDDQLVRIPLKTED